MCILNKVITTYRRSVMSKQERNLKVIAAHVILDRVESNLDYLISAVRKRNVSKP